MEEINWLDILGWSKEELEDLRFVGYSYLKQGKYDVATAFFEALVVLDPKSIYDLQTLGALYLEQGNHLTALNTIEQALKLEPEHEPTQLNRVKTLFALGYKNQALTKAKELTLSKDQLISNQASALILAYSGSSI